MKKKLTTWALCLTAAISPLMFTGCSSDITFNQKDLDETINNINEYLETQNNYSSEYSNEYSKQQFNNYIFKSLKDSENETNLKIQTFITKINPVTNIIEQDSSLEYKYYNNENNGTINAYIKDPVGEVYIEYKLNPEKKYNKTMYEIDFDKKYVKTSSVVDNVPEHFDIIRDFNTSRGALNLLVDYVLSTEHFSVNYNMELDKNLTKFNLIICDNINTNEIIKRYLNIVFDGDKLLEINMDESSRLKDEYYYSGTLSRTSVKFTRNISDFTFDKEGYVEK